MRKALTSQADALVFDLESAIPRSQADQAREICRRVLDDHGADRPALFVRVCDARSPEQARDLAAFVGSGLRGILLPQVTDVADVMATDEALTRWGNIDTRAPKNLLAGIRIVATEELDRRGR